MNWSIKKPWCRILSVMMSLALTITLLSGCGASEPTQTVTNVQVEKQELVHICEQVEDTIRQLECDLSEGSNKHPEDTVAKLEKLLADTEEKTEQWLEEQGEISEGLSENTAKVLGERNDEFANRLAVNQKQVEGLLADIVSALKKGNTDEASRITNELDAMLIPEQEPKTYGEILPGEAQVQEAEVVELESTDGETVSAETSKTTPVELSEKTLSELLVTKEDTALNDELKAKAEELGTPLAVYNYVKNNIGYEYYYGSRKGAIGTYAAFGGNDID